MSNLRFVKPNAGHRPISTREIRRVSKALDIIAASPDSRRHSLYLGESGSKSIVVRRDQIDRKMNGSLQYEMVIYTGDDSNESVRTFFKVGAHAYRFPPSWRHTRMRWSSDRSPNDWLHVVGLTKKDILDSLTWFAAEDPKHEMFEIHMGNRGFVAAMGQQHPLEYAPENARHSSLLNGVRGRPSRAIAYLKKEHPRAMLHHNIVREVARRRAERAAQEEALAAHKAKMDIVHMNLMHRPPIGQLPGGPGYLATGAAFRNRAASSGSNRSNRSNRSKRSSGSSGSKRKRN